MTLTLSEAAILARRGPGAGSGGAIPCREGWHDGALTVFVPGRPTHYKGKGHRYTVSKHTKDWRERTATHLLRFLTPSNRGVPVFYPADPKRITFTVYSRNAFDDDNLAFVCSGCRDGVKDMRVIQDDRKSAGHTFVYNNVATRAVGAVLGIALRIELAECAPALG